MALIMVMELASTHMLRHRMSCSILGMGGVWLKSNAGLFLLV